MKKEIEKIEAMVDEIELTEGTINVLETIGLKENEPTNKRKLRSKKLLGIPLPIIIVLISSVLVGGVLVSGWGWYHLNMTGSIVVNQGETPKCIFWDGVLAESQEFSIPMDISEIDSGTTVLANHELYSPPADGKWDVSFNCVELLELLGQDPYDDTKEFYGFYFDILDNVSGLSILDDIIYVGNGDTFYVDFRYEVDEFFQHTPNPLDFNISVDVTEHAVILPVAVDDTFSYVPHTPIELDVLANDIFDPYMFEGLEITQIVSKIHAGDTVEIIGVFPNQRINYIGTSSVEGGFEYEVMDGEGNTDIGNVITLG